MEIDDQLYIIGGGIPNKAANRYTNMYSSSGGSLSLVEDIATTIY